jgi:lipopolysaccharide/colanic/teichoic acid biosynthesis glycosyltransferase
VKARAVSRVHVTEPSPPRFWWKRPLDFTLALTALVLLAPLLLCIVVLIRIDSPGPALFGQQRIGRLGVPFTLWKFRSMYLSSSQEVHQRVSQDWFAERAAGVRYKSADDPRVTRFGKYIRRSSLDELPQLFNVLRGEMSLVGPRPTMAYERSRYESWYFERELAPPGITGLWQVTGRDRLSAPQMVALDVRYVRECSLWLDLKILALTVPAVLADLR